MSLADCIKSKSESKLGCPFVWGAWGPDKFDCSGLLAWTFRSCGAQWKGAAWPRLTADLYYKAGTPISLPSRVGDAACWVGKSDKAYHIGFYIGDGWVIEARGRRWGVVKYQTDDPIHGTVKRKAVWRRFNWLNVGDLTEDDMNEMQDELLKLNRLSNVARSYDVLILSAIVKSDDAAAGRLREERQAAVEAERVRLGLPRGLVV